MDWAPTEMMQAVQQLARQVLKDDPTNWDALVEAQLLDLDDLLDQATLLIEVGRAGAQVPVLETLCLGWPLRRTGQVPSGAIVTAGLVEAGRSDPRNAATEVRDGRAFGVKIAVPAADRATHMVCVATDGVYAVALSDCAIELGSGSNGDPLGRVRMDGAPATRVGDLDDLDAWFARIDVGVSALLLGLATTALKMTATYVRERQQFGKPIGTFQAVGQRAADAWIDQQGMEVTLWSAAWRVQHGVEAERSLAIARWQAAEGAHRITAAAQHLHGGMGFDRDYPLHRYFLTVKQWEHLLGGPGHQLERLG